MTGKEYIRPIPATWWIHNRHVALFMIRELTCVFVAGYAIFLMVMLYRFSQSREAFHAFFLALQSPASVFIQLITLAFVVFHSVTSIQAAPVLMVIWRGEEKAEPHLIIRVNYAAWAVLSILILVVAVGRGQ